MKLTSKSNQSLLIRIGSLLFLIFLISPRFIHPATPAGIDLFDAVRGVIFGVYVGLFLIVIRRSRNNAGGSPCG